MPTPDPLDSFHAALEARHLSELTFAEVRRALQALSSVYVERRERMAEGAVFDGAGKRAAFALYYGPMHFLLVREIARALGPSACASRRILDLGCGTGTAGAAWALECGPRTRVEAVDRNGWAVAEARWTLARFGLDGRATRADAATAPLPKPPGRHPRRVHRQRARGRSARRACCRASSTRRGRARPSSWSSRSPGASPRGGRSGRRRSAPRAGARTSGACVPPSPRGSPCSARPPASTPAS